MQPAGFLNRHTNKSPVVSLEREGLLVKISRLLNLLAIAVPGILIALCLYIGWQWRTTQTALANERRDRVSEVAEFHSKQERLIVEVTELQTDLRQAKEWPFLVCSDDAMQAKGLRDPARDLAADLNNHTDLIPFQPIGGGKTTIGLWLINCDWVLAGVGDGHKAIWAMLHYEVTNGQIKWTVLATE